MTSTLLQRKKEVLKEIVNIFVQLKMGNDNDQVCKNTEFEVGMSCLCQLTCHYLTYLVIYWYGATL